MLCVCCGIELDGDDVDFHLARVGQFDGYCRDCLPNRCPACG